MTPPKAVHNFGAAMRNQTHEADQHKQTKGDAQNGDTSLTVAQPGLEHAARV